MRSLCAYATAVFAAACASAVPQSEQEARFIRYTAISPPLVIGELRGNPECWHPYLIEVHSNGLVSYEGSRCVREIGKRTFNVPSAQATRWIRELERSDFFGLAPMSTHLMDSQMFSLELHLGTRSHLVRASVHGSNLPRNVVRVVEEMMQQIDPHNRWACLPERWVRCAPPR